MKKGDYCNELLQNSKNARRGNVDEIEMARKISGGFGGA